MGKVKKKPRGFCKSAPPAVAMAGNPVVYYSIPSNKEGCAVNVQVGDILEMKKNHPCGANRFAVLRVGMDFRIKCEGCGHEMLVPRLKIERHIKRIHRQHDTL